ncbi:MAG: tyrosine-type recombinase/integrase [Candidatus Cryptobacteroides sp.]
MDIIHKYLRYISLEKRYSDRTLSIYENVLKGFMDYYAGADEWNDGDVGNALKPIAIRNYEVWLLDSKGLSAKTVNLHLSVISAFSKYLLKEGVVSVNPVKLINRPKINKRLPVFFRKDKIEKYFSTTSVYASEENMDMLTGKDKVAEEYYEKRRKRLVIKILYDTGLRRAELIGLNKEDFDLGRGIIRVLGKGNKMREIPVLPSLSKEISLYLQATALMKSGDIQAKTPLILSKSGRRLYPMEVERIVKEELGDAGIMGKTSPHVLRHTLATGLLDSGADLNSIKEMLGHSSLAATQVYTHNSIEKLKQVYKNAHPRAKRGGIMEIRVKSLKFNADQKLLDFVEKKVSKLERFDETIDYVDVIMSLMEKPDNKSVKLQAGMPGGTLMIERTARSFEEAINEGVDAMKEKLVRNKEKKSAQ